MPRRRPRIRLPLLLAVSAVLLSVTAYIFGLAHYQASGSRLFEPRDLYIPRSIDMVVVAWCLWVGSSIGSFLNVVAWRMPRGEGINGRSHCPRCLTQLKARDNFPVFGWLALGGRCRTCHLPISPRYPIVEAVVGATLTMVAVSQLYRLSLPRQIVHWHGGPFWAPVVDHRVLLVLLYHTLALTISWAFGLIRIDHHKLPRRLVAFGFAVTVVPMLVYPTLMVVPWQFQVDEFWNPRGLHLDAVLRAITAIVAATIIARYLARGLCPLADPKLDPLSGSTARLIDLIAILAIPFLVIGWQSAPAVTVLAAVIAAAAGRWLPASSDALGRLAISMPAAMTVQLVLWRRLHAEGEGVVGNIGWWPSDGSSPWVFLGWTAILLAVPLWLREPPDLEDGQLLAGETRPAANESVEHGEIATSADEADVPAERGQVEGEA